MPDSFEKSHLLSLLFVVNGQVDKAKENIHLLLNKPKSHAITQFRREVKLATELFSLFYDFSELGPLV